jgi:(S)-2-hydroxy-acid oxidase
MAKNDVTESRRVPTDDPITVAEVEFLARKRLPKAVYDYYACGSDDQDALKRNIDAYSR